MEDYLLHQGYEKTLYSLRNAKKETWLRESVMDTTSSSPVDLISIPMETETEQHSSMLNKYDEVNVGDISEMQAEYMDEDWTPGLPAASSDQCGVELERNDSNSRNDDVDEEKKTQDKDVESIPVSTMLLKGTSMELFQKHLHVRSSVRWHLLSGDVAKAMNILKWVYIYIYYYVGCHFRLICGWSFFQTFVSFDSCTAIIATLTVTYISNHPGPKFQYWNKNHIFGAL